MWTSTATSAPPIGRGIIKCTAPVCRISRDICQESRAGNQGADLSYGVAFRRRSRRSVCIRREKWCTGTAGKTGALRETTRDLARIAVNLTGYRYITEENHDASFSDYCVLNLGIPAITVEIGNGKGSSLVPADQIPGIILENRFLWTSVAAYFAE